MTIGERNLFSKDPHFISDKYNKYNGKIKTSIEYQNYIYCIPQLRRLTINQYSRDAFFFLNNIILSDEVDNMMYKT